jgi:hypothetical protein
MRRTVLVTSRQGAIFKIDIPSSQTDEVRGIPDSVAIGQGGLLDVVVRNSDIYLCYTKQVAPWSLYNSNFQSVSYE